MSHAKEFRKLKKQGKSNRQAHEALGGEYMHQNLAYHNHLIQGPDNYCFKKRGTK